jgi:hypothetical protein
MITALGVLTFMARLTIWFFLGFLLIAQQTAAQPLQGNVNKTATLLQPEAASPDTLPFQGKSATPNNISPASHRQWRLTIGAPHDPSLQDLPIEFVGGSPIYSREFVTAWNYWVERLLHMVYSNLSAQSVPSDNSRNSFTGWIAIRSDGAIQVVGAGDNPCFKRATEALSGLPALHFPTDTPTDTIRIWVSCEYGQPPEAQKDDWGRPSQSASYPWYQRYAW